MILAIVLSMVLLCHLVSSSYLRERPDIVFKDDFESPIDQWTVFEEVVGGSACYASGIAKLSRAHAAAKHGRYGLNVWANHANSNFSNHLIAGRSIPLSALNRFPHGQNSMITFTTQAFIPLNSEQALQTGPELSIQNTRSSSSSSSVSHTAIAGIQYIPSKYIPQKWNIWVPAYPGATYATWRALEEVQDVALEANQWYTIRLTADFSKNEYVRLVVSRSRSTSSRTSPPSTATTTTTLPHAAMAAVGPGPAPVMSIDLSGTPIALENRGFAPATVITLEAENLYNNCGAAGPFSSQVFYDNVVVSVHD